MQLAVASEAATFANSLPCADSAQPESHCSHESSACDDEVSQASLPVPCFQPKPVSRGRVGLLKRNATSAGFSPCLPVHFVPGQKGLPSIRVKHTKQRSGTDLTDALCEAGLVNTPPRESADGTPLSNCSAFQDSDNKGSCSESEHVGGSYASWAPRALKEGTSTSRGSRLKGLPGLEKRRKLRLPVTGPFSARAGAPLDTSPRNEGDFRLEGKGSVNVSEQGSGNLPYLAGGQVLCNTQQDHGRLARKKPNSASRQRTSCFMGVGSSNRKNQWQARILVHGKVTHLGYYETEEEAARVYDQVAIALNGPSTQTNFPAAQYSSRGLAEFRGLGREDLQRKLGVKPMDKSSQFRGVSRKKGKWEAKVMVNRKWAFRALYDNEDEAARAYDSAVRRLKPKEAGSYVNFKDHSGPRRTPASKGRPSKSGSRSRAQAADYWGAPAQLVTQPVAQLEQSDSDSQPLQDVATMFPSSSGLPCTLPALSSLPSAAEAVKIAQLQQDDLVSCSMADLSPQHSALHRRPSFNQIEPLQPSLSGMPLVALPDPNSIGVPPPSYGLPFPELVASSAETLQQQPQLGHSGLPEGTGLVLPAAVNLPLIPPPLLPAEASRLTRAISTSSLAPSSGRDLCPAGRTCEQPNPFQESAALAPPISRVPSSGGPGFNSEGSVTLSAMPSQGSAALSRCASGSVMRSLDSLPDASHRESSYGATANGLSGLPSIPQQGGAVMRNFRAAPAPIPPSVFSDYPALQTQGSFAGTAAGLPRAPSCVSSLTGANDMLSGSAALSATSHQLDAALSAASNMMLTHELAPYGGGQGMGVSVSLPFSSAPAAFAAMTPAGVMDPMGKQIEPDMGGMDREDAAEIMAQLGVNVLEPECHPPPLQAFQIGGEDLGMFAAP